MSYVINTKANPGQVRLAERAVAAAGGVVVSPGRRSAWSSRTPTAPTSVRP